MRCSAAGHHGLVRNAQTLANAKWMIQNDTYIYNIIWYTLTDWLTDWLVHWLLTDWLIDWLNDWLIDWLNDWFIDWLTNITIQRVQFFGGISFCFYYFVFFVFSVSGTCPCYLLHFGTKTCTLLNFGAKICHLHCSSIFPWFYLFFPWCSLIYPKCSSIFR